MLMRQKNATESVLYIHACHVDSVKYLTLLHAMMRSHVVMRSSCIGMRHFFLQH